MTGDPAAVRSTPFRCVLLRHGWSLANEAALIVSRTVNATHGYGLAPEGADEVRRSIAGALEEGTLPGPWRIISSPLLRARESAEVAAALLEAPVEIDERLTERDFGALELAPEARYQEVWARDRRDPGHTLWGVESVEGVWARASSLVDELRSATGSGSALLCTHGDVASVLYCGMAGAPLARHREEGGLANGELRVLPAGSGPGAGSVRPSGA